MASANPLATFSVQLVASIALQVLCSVTFAIVIILIRRDYLSFLALGPGGTPQTCAGYLRVKFLGLFALRNRYAPFPIPENMPSQEGSLHYLPKRKRTRPTTRGIAPHRQINQKSEPSIFQQMAAKIESLAPGDKNELAIGTSCFEKHGTGLFSRSPVNETCRGEIVHIHPSDGSMHMTLHPADANIVLEAGWCERHPLAGVFRNRFLPRGFVMVYAPQNYEEIALVMEIIRAACWFVGQGDAAKAALDMVEGADGGEGFAPVCTRRRAGTFVENYLNQRQIEDPTKALDRI